MQANIEHLFTESESRTEELEEIDATFDTQAIQSRIEAQARQKAEKLIKKNKRELDRLKRHAAECLEKNNKTGYIYAIKKLRDFYRQPYTDELVESMWKSSRQALFDIAHAASKQK
ncbi:hypothetical protein ABNavy71_106 [Acinetobacter phage AB-Navy71]|uniref:Uncharacterized protein n=1 Tax=Acinetobacter phage AbTZA1 TaxID=2500827 RepID=A0A3Q9R731_9CAUD|nr:hypothetical protein HYP74_gp214 [Acinetobacter phage AbTZA1]QQM13844.1 hypothetical protein CPT_Maestro_110 [Acinetobacter phage Maestro]QQM18600.1 hypothetical protein CPT_Morttis_107 [Acinetobacter phage Morttis]QQO96810.1 hypothetical protein CPT_Melin_109 [Acinetobacter phage Melin]UQS94183.1 hypothetical protein ABNavy71_106 [Acinetobacter phage AB-Navy71]SSU39243.1 Protein of uncharacterised function (DUF2654) [Acinetobacter baumannii]